MDPVWCDRVVAPIVREGDSVPFRSGRICVRPSAQTPVGEMCPNPARYSMRPASAGPFRSETSPASD